MAKTPPARTKRTYSNSDKAKVHAFLISNDGNVSKTSKETGIPIGTIRDWKELWEADGVPDEVIDALPAVTGDWLSRAEATRDMALDKIRELIPHARVTDLRSLNSILGSLTDKIDRMQGVTTQRVEITHHHPSLDEQNALIQKLAAATLDAVDRRHEVIDAEIFEEEQAPKGLPSPHPTEE